VGRSKVAAPRAGRAAQRREDRFVSLRHSLLGLLADRAMSGYDLAKRFRGSLWHAWYAQHSQIYPELARLLEQGLIRAEDTGSRGRKTYAITEKGLDEVRRWTAEFNVSPERGRNPATLRAFFVWLLEQEDVEEFFRHELEQHRAQLVEFEEMARTNSPARPAEKAAALALEWGVRYERARAEWAEWALEQVRREPLWPRTGRRGRGDGSRSQAAVPSEPGERGTMEL
jgi:PadR family transcriptional regulator, regulatory protein AphA